MISVKPAATVALVLGMAAAGATCLTAMSAQAADKGHAEGEKYVPEMDNMKGMKVEEPGAKPGVPAMTAEEFSQAKDIFFQRCAGCQGVLRKGATGPNITPEVTRDRGYDGVHALPIGRPPVCPTGALRAS